MARMQRSSVIWGKRARRGPERHGRISSSPAAMARRMSQSALARHMAQSAS
jgi:hypothetical protein